MRHPPTLRYFLLRQILPPSPNIYHVWLRWTSIMFGFGGLHPSVNLGLPSVGRARMVSALLRTFRPQSLTLFAPLRDTPLHVASQAHFAWDFLFLVV